MGRWIMEQWMRREIDKFIYKFNKRFMYQRLQEYGAPKAGINYLVPLSWWQNFYSLNHHLQDPAKYRMENIRIEHLVDTFLYDFQQELVQELEEKCNYIQFNKVLISPQIFNHQHWKVVSPALWKVIRKAIKQPKPILTFYSHPQTQLHQNLVQLRLIFCSKARSDAFVGYLPKHIELIASIREIGFQMGFVEMQNSKITFPEVNPQKNYTFHDIETRTIENAADTFVMVFNMERVKDDENGGQNKKLLNQSNQAVMGDMDTMLDDSKNQIPEVRANDRTLSTGAETPFFSFMVGSDGYQPDREYRMNEIFGAKQPYEIEQMRQYAEDISKSDLISIPTGNEEGLQGQLNKLAEEMIEQMHKKVHYKEKQHLHE